MTLHALSSLYFHVMLGLSKDLHHDHVRNRIPGQQLSTRKLQLCLLQSYFPIYFPIVFMSTYINFRKPNASMKTLFISSLAYSHSSGTEVNKITKSMHQAGKIPLEYPQSQQILLVDSFSCSTPLIPHRSRQ